MVNNHQGYPMRYVKAIGDNWEYHPEDTILMPGGPDGRYGTSQEGNGKCVYSKTKYPEWALRAIGYTVSYEAGLTSLDVTGSYTPRSSVNLYFAEHGYPHYALIDELSKSEDVEPYPMPWNFRDVEVLDVFSNTLDPLWSLTETWERQAPVVQKEVQKIYDLPRP